MTNAVSTLTAISIPFIRRYNSAVLYFKEKMSANFQLDENIGLSESKSLWVFGYGSLCWRPGFEFDKAVIGHIKGFSRKFWQGNDVHRGTQEKPGRVVTLVEDNESTVYGIAFAISGEAAISYLSQRECKLGGYDTKFTTFYPSRGSAIANTLLYVATPTNSLWLGDAPISEMAEDITESKGLCGYNVEYLLRLANFMRQYCPEVDDSHLFSLENEVLRRINDRKLCVRTLMGEGRGCITFKRIVPLPYLKIDMINEDRVSSFEFSTKMPIKALRCMNTA